MYILRDAIGPAIRAHKDALGFKNIILRHWPRKADGTFGRLIVQYPSGVVKDNAHRRIYHALGVKIAELEKNPIDGDEIDYIYIRLEPYKPIGNRVIEKSDIRKYIEEFSPLIYPRNTKDVFNLDPQRDVSNNITNLNTDPFIGLPTSYWDKDGWITTQISYTPVTLDMIDKDTTDVEIIQKIKSMSYSDIFFDVSSCNRLATLAILDVNNSVFEAEYRVVLRTVAEKTSNIKLKSLQYDSGYSGSVTSYVQSAIVEFRFRRVTDVARHIIFPETSAVELFLTNVVDQVLYFNSGLTPEMLASGVASNGSFVASVLSAKAAQDQVLMASSSFFMQLSNMANWIDPATGDSTMLVDDAGANDYYPSSDSISMKVDGIKDLPPQEFQKEFSKLVKFDYKVHEKKGHWYDKFVIWVILIAAIVLSYLFPPIGLPMMALYVSLTAIAEGLWAMYLVKNGGGIGAIHITMKVSNVLGIAAMVLGIMAVYQSVQKALLESSLRAAINSAIQSGSQAAIDSASVAYNAAVNSGTAAYAGSIGSVIADAAVSTINALNKIGIINGTTADILGAIGGSYDTIASIGTTKATSITLEAITDNIATGITKFVSKPLSEIINQTVNWLQAGFNAYMTYVNPPGEGLADKAAALEKSEKELDSTTPDTVETSARLISDPYGNIWETPDTAAVCKIMTDGRIASSMNKYYFSYIT